MYVQLGFTTSALDGGTYHCRSYRKECPVFCTKHGTIIGKDYIVDDNLQRMLVLKHWIYNVSPPGVSSTSSVAAASQLWNVPGVPHNQYLSSALVPPLNNNESTLFTNSAYIDLLNCRLNIGESPYVLPDLLDGTEAAPLPADRNLSTRTISSKLYSLVSAPDIAPIDIRRSLFRNLEAHIGGSKLNGFDALAAPLYTEGKLYEGDDSSNHTEMALELRLNLVAFYRRCAHYPIVDPTLETWSKLAIQEFKYAVINTTVSEMGLDGFNGTLSSFHDDRLEWSKNFKILADRLDLECPPLWFDLYALEMLFGMKMLPILIAPVYGMIVPNPPDHYTKVIARVPLFDTLAQVGGNHNNNLEQLSNKEFTVVPIFVLNPVTFGYFSCGVGSKTRNVSAAIIRDHIVNFPEDIDAHVAEFRKLPKLSVFGGRLDDAANQDRTFPPGHCASQVLCQMKTPSPPAELKVNRCPGCGQPVHSICGYRNEKAAARDGVTCYCCFDKFGKALCGSSDPEFFPENPNATQTAPTENTPDSPAKNTRGNRPTGSCDTTSRQLSASSTYQTRREKDTVAKQASQRKAFDTSIDAHNPKGMYSTTDTSNSEPEWWLDSDGSPIENLPESPSHLARSPNNSHVYSRFEMDAYSEKNSTEKRKTFKEIIRSAIALATYLKTCDAWTGTKQPVWLHKPDQKYSDQELVNICCLVDRGRAFNVDTQFTSTSQFAIHVQSYKLAPRLALKHYVRTNKKEIPAASILLYVYRKWLHQYLDWFNPDLYEYITSHADGMTVATLPKRLAAKDQDSYDQQGRIVKDKLLIPLSKMHKVVSTKEKFGVSLLDGNFLPFCTDTYAKRPSYSQAVRVSHYDSKLTASCNPAGFEIVPVARMPTLSVPEEHMQIKGIRAQIQKTGRGDSAVDTVRWLGLQGGKYVSLPLDWVHHNFDPELLEDALKRALDAKKGTGTITNQRFLKMPPGDCREDDPPFLLRHSQGLNYYYQDQIDNCLLGGLANAIFWMVDQDSADRLLNNYIPVQVSRLKHFSVHVNKTLLGYALNTFTCSDVLKSEDCFPMVIQLRSKDQSESHAICIYKGCIYDSASRFVLVKGRETLDWCCGQYGFERHLRIYRLEPLSTTTKGKTKKKRPRGYN
jgi:hypothetical protein